MTTRRNQATPELKVFQSVLSVAATQLSARRTPADRKRTFSLAELFLRTNAKDSDKFLDGDRWEFCGSTPSSLPHTDAT